MKQQTAPRCSYCHMPSVVWFQQQSWISKQGSPRMMNWKVGTCAEHAGCANWISQLAIHKPTLIRADVTAVG